jgi:hypothetical protein
MSNLYDNLNNIVIKYNSNFGNTINLLCDNKIIVDNIKKKYNVNILTKPCANLIQTCSAIECVNVTTNEIKKCLTIIYTNDIFDVDIIKCVNTFINNKIKICLIVKSNFDFNKFVRTVSINDINSISWSENGDKSMYI